MARRLCAETLKNEPTATAAIPLVDLLPELAALADGPLPGGLTYYAMWTLVTAGRLPAFRVRRSWFVQRTDIPAAAQLLGVTLRREAA